jgi:hypothetical protein
MTLKQKFFDIYTSYYKKSNELDKMVEVADDYAIEFAEWLFDVSRIGTTKELLEIFKKEKGL